MNKDKILKSPLLLEQKPFIGNSWELNEWQEGEIVGLIHKALKKEFKALVNGYLSLSYGKHHVTIHTTAGQYEKTYAVKLTNADISTKATAGAAVKTALHYLGLEK